MDTESIIFTIGPLAITRPVVTTWAVMLGLTLLCAIATRRLKLNPGPFQTMLEGIVGTIHDAIDDTLPDYGVRLLPFIGTLWIFIAIANLVGVLPGASSPTGDLSTTAALAILVFLSVHWFGIRGEGVRAYLSHYVQPSPIMLPFHNISEISRTVALAVRLFGN
ncbi:MAG: F0F1 ATP synthase subunit A, partial [Azoarcus sp.]